jgi:hypothetical protein
MSRDRQGGRCSSFGIRNKQKLCRQRLRTQGQGRGSATVGCQLFTCQVPLSGMEDLPLPSSLTHLHVVVVIQEEGERGGQRLVCFDFLPVDPTSPATLFRLLAGQGVPGEIRERALQVQVGPKKSPSSVRVGPRKTWSFQGNSGSSKGTPQQCVERARAFSSTYPKTISLYSNSCETYARRLLSHLKEL